MSLRPLHHRLFIVIWLVWLTWCAITLVMLANTYVSAEPETFPSSATGFATPAPTVPRSVVEAYKEGKMTPQERKEFEADLRSGIAIPPIEVKIVLPPRYPSFSGSIGNVFLLVALPALGIALLQYLVVGFASPKRLFERRECASLST
jgi:hypothetical protein